MGQPDGDSSEDGGGAVDDGEFVVTGREPSPLLEVAEAAFNHIAVAVVERRRMLVAGRRGSRGASRWPIWSEGCGNDRDDPAFAQVGADRAGGVGLIAPHPLRDGSAAGTVGPGDVQMREQAGRSAGASWAWPAPTSDHQG